MHTFKHDGGGCIDASELISESLCLPPQLDLTCAPALVCLPLRSLSNATIGQFTAKVDFLSSQGLLGCMGREAILKLAPCFTYGVRG